MMTKEQRVAAEILLSDRLYLYTMLHKVFGREPDFALLELLTSEMTGYAFALLCGEDDDLLCQAADFFSKVRKDSEDPAFLDSARDEYMRLFVGPGKIVAPPWESVYCGDDELLFQESTRKVRETYRAYGLMPEGYPRVPDDSLALELDFMAMLAQRSLDALNQDDTASLLVNLEGSVTFLEEHLLVWIPAFVKRASASSEGCLYPQLARLLDCFLRADGRSLEELITAVREG